MKSFNHISNLAAACLFMLLLLTAITGAATLYVDDNAINDPGPFDPNSSDPMENGSVNHPFDLVQEAINATGISATEIVIMPGLYPENIIINSKIITLTSVDPTNPCTTVTTILDANFSGTVITMANSTITLHGLTIQNGRSAFPGGGIKSEYCNLDINNCVIRNNYSVYYGGGLFHNSTITQPNHLNATGSLIIDNYARDRGGGIDCIHGYVNFNSCLFKRNETKFNGGGLSLNRAVAAKVQNCLFLQNTARDGGGIDVSLSNTNITNCSFYKNSAIEGNGVDYYLGSQENFIKNCIIWGGSGSDISRTFSGYPNVSYCCTQDSEPGIGNISTDPLFIDVSSTSADSWDLHLRPDSPCIDAGTNTPYGGLPVTDMEGNQRTIDGDGNGSIIADMGAYELPSIQAAHLHIWPKFLSLSGYEADSNPIAQIVRVYNLGNQPFNWSINTGNKPEWLTVSPTNGPLSPNTSTSVTLSADTSDLSKGVYCYSFQLTNSASQTKTITVRLQVSPNARIYYVDDNALNDPGPCDPNVSDAFEDGSAMHPFDVVQEGINAAINGDTVIVYPGRYQTISLNCKDIVLKSAAEDAAITVLESNGNNSVVTFSGLETSLCRITGFTITGGCQSEGGGIKGFGTYAGIENCVISANRSGSEGGGIWNCDGNIVNCIVKDNYSTNDAGISGCEGSILNCTVVQNTAYYESGGIGGGCWGPITNCIIWGNYSPTNPNIRASSTPTYSCIQGWTGGGTGNISSNPLFVDAANGDFHLKSHYGRWNSVAGQWQTDAVTSPCIDAGDPLTLWHKELWPNGARVNMGAYGSTPQASMSGSTVGNVADLNHDNSINLADFDILSEDWLVSEYLLDTDLNRNGTVDIGDLVSFAEQWL